MPDGEVKADAGMGPGRHLAESPQQALSFSCLDIRARNDQRRLRPAEQDVRLQQKTAGLECRPQDAAIMHAGKPAMAKRHRAKPASFKPVRNRRAIRRRQSPPAADPGKKPDNREPERAEENRKGQDNEDDRPVYDTAPSPLSARSRKAFKISTSREPLSR